MFKKSFSIVRRDDDGHAAKLIRALAQRENICAAYGMDDPVFSIKADLWLQLGHMDKYPPCHSWTQPTMVLVIDSTEDTGDNPSWISRILRSLGKLISHWFPSGDPTRQAADSLRL